MKVIVRVFASLRETIGKDQIELDVSTGMTPRQIAELVAKEFPKSADHLNSLSYAVDDEFVPADQTLENIRELALIPPVSGG